MIEEYIEKKNIKFSLTILNIDVLKYREIKVYNS